MAILYLMDILNYNVVIQLLITWFSGMTRMSRK